LHSKLDIYVFITNYDRPCMTDDRHSHLQKLTLFFFHFPLFYHNLFNTLDDSEEIILLFCYALSHFTCCIGCNSRRSYTINPSTKRTSSSSHWILNSSRHDIAEKLSWVGVKQQSLTHSSTKYQFQYSEDRWTCLPTRTHYPDYVLTSLFLHKKYHKIINPVLISYAVTLANTCWNNSLLGSLFWRIGANNLLVYADLFVRFCTEIPHFILNWQNRTMLCWNHSNRWFYMHRFVLFPGISVIFFGSHLQRTSLI
jgi:hypothetical protein